MCSKCATKSGESYMQAISNRSIKHVRLHEDRINMHAASAQRAVLNSEQCCQHTPVAAHHRVPQAGDRHPAGSVAAALLLGAQAPSTAWQGTACKQKAPALLTAWQRPATAWEPTSEHESAVCSLTENDQCSIRGQNYWITLEYFLLLHRARTAL